MFKQIINNAISQATAVVIFLLTNDPISFLLLVKMISGIRAKAIPNDKITWLITRAFEGFTPIKIITSGGVMVMNRLK